MENRKARHNSTYPKVAVQWLNQDLCFYQSFCLVDSEVLRNRHLRVARKPLAATQKQHINKKTKYKHYDIFRISRESFK